MGRRTTFPTTGASRLGTPRQRMHVPASRQTEKLTQNGECLNVRAQNIKPLAENTGANLCDHGLSNDFLGKTQKSQY